MRKPRDERSDRVAEPVQVYLSPADRARLERLAEQLDATRSDVLRRGLEALEHNLLNPAQHPALRLIGSGRPDTEDGTDAAREHDRLLADLNAQDVAMPRRPRGTR